MEQMDERYLDERFNRILDKLEQIHFETKRTNGRVTKLEEKVIQLDKDGERFKEFCNKVNAMEEEILPLKFYRHYPKLNILTILLLIVYGILQFFIK